MNEKINSLCDRFAIDKYSLNKSSTYLYIDRIAVLSISKRGVNVLEPVFIPKETFALAYKILVIYND